MCKIGRKGESGLLAGITRRMKWPLTEMWKTVMKYFFWGKKEFDITWTVFEMPVKHLL